MLRLEGVTVRYGPIRAVQDVSLEVRPGEVLALLGPNGAGKSSTLAGVMGAAPVVDGHIFLDDTEITYLPTEDIVRLGISLTPEGRRIFSALTVEENLRLGAATRRKELDTQWRSVLELFPVLGERLRMPAASLSGGQQQQLAIARSLMSQPRVLLLDEPSIGLAPIVVDALFHLIGELAHRGIAVLLVEQHGERALELADSCVVLGAGRVSFAGPADALQSPGALASAYLGSPVTGP